MQIVEVPIQNLKSAEYNPRQMTEKQIKDLTESIKEFGLVDPLIVNSHKGRENVVVGGHQRLKIALQEGFKTIPVVYIDLDEKSEQKLNLRLNRNLGEWNYDLLANFGKEELLNVGFTNEELDKIFNLEEDNFDAQAEYDQIVEPTTKLGDLYQLGSHRLLCGDSTQPEAVSRVMGGVLADMVFTDPPYNVNYDYDWRSDLHKGKKVKHNFFNDKKSDDDYYKFIKDVFTNAYNFTKDNANFYCWYASRHHTLVERGLIDSKWLISQVISWIKNYPVLSISQDFHRTQEPCLHGWKKGKKHFHNNIHNFRDIINWDELDELLDIWYEKRDLLMDYKHPTQKPIRLAERAIKMSSTINGVILECFNGSGSTMMACEQLQRKCYAIELDPIYIDVAIKRWELYTNKKAIKL